MTISWPNPIFDHLLGSSRGDNSYKVSNIGFGQVITQVESIGAMISVLNAKLYEQVGKH